jgi:periplasmic divalent cation tolerance protein
MEGEKPPRVLSLVTTVASMEDASRLARLLLEERLAACVQVEPGLVSHYVWQGKRCEEPELRLTIKTLPDLAGRVQELFAAHHPYELPQFLATEMQASAAYAAWVSEAVAARPNRPG